MQYKLGFSQNEDGKLLVITEVLTSAQRSVGYTVTPFSDENVFLYYVVLADLDDEATTSIISNVLLVLSDRSRQAGWTLLDASERQVRAMGLSLPRREKQEYPGGFSGLLKDGDLRAVFTQAPTPITLLIGPQHQFAFINPAYLQLIGRKCMTSVLGKTVREVLPELQGQPFFGLLDNVYRTGEPFVGTEIPAHIVRGEGQATEEVYFDFVYHPVRDGDGEVSGILCHANDVTERVLARQVSDARELQLYRQWAELEAVYRGSPVGMALVDTQEYRLLRINDMNAKLLGAPSSELVGCKVFDLFPDFSELREIYNRVAAGEEIRHVEMDVIGAGLNVHRLLINFSPVLDSCGCVEAIASVAFDCTEMMQPSEIPVLRLDVTWSGLRNKYHWQ